MVWWIVVVVVVAIVAGGALAWRSSGRAPRLQGPDAEHQRWGDEGESRRHRPAGPFDIGAGGGGG